MQRREFIKFGSMAALGLGAISCSGTKETAKYLDDLSEQLDENDTVLPSFFIGHGNPMNGIEENEFSLKWRALGASLQTPKLILCISAHWLTRGTFITGMDKPRTIHDFGPISPDLFKVQYDAPGDPEQAKYIAESIASPHIELDNDWGLDHGSWTIIRQMFPNADIPVLQLSISYHEKGEFHHALGQKLRSLRKKGVLIIGSGNIVHNLRKIGRSDGKPLSLDQANEEFGFDWAIEANELVKAKIMNSDHLPLFDYEKLGKAVKQAVPSPDHYYPLLYALGSKFNNENVSLFNDKCVVGSISMTSVQIG